MTWWDSFTSQFVADLIAGAAVMGVALYVENYLDEVRTQRQDRRERKRKHD